jgi:Mn2+/Fe2+ NRAMP family transporter
MGIQGRDVKQRYAVYDEASQMLWGETVAQPHGQIERLLVIHFFEGSTHAQQYTITAGQCLLLSDKLLGPFAEDLFAIGIIGAGLVAIPVLLASTSYAVAGSLEWPGSLSKKPWQNEGFYLILTAALLASLLIALLRIDPLALLFWANVVSGVLSPILVVYLLMVATNRTIIRGQKVGLLTTLGLLVTIVVMSTAALLLVYGLFTGQH